MENPIILAAYRAGILQGLRRIGAGASEDRGGEGQAGVAVAIHVEQGAGRRPDRPSTRQTSVLLPPPLIPTRANT